MTQPPSNLGTREPNEPLPGKRQSADSQGSQPPHGAPGAPESQETLASGLATAEGNGPNSPEAHEGEGGLSSAQARERAARGQANRLPKPADGGVAAIVRRNVLTLFNLLNLALAALLVAVGSYRNLLFMGVVVSNSAIGLIQELRAKRTHDRLLLLSQGQVRALRDGAEVRLPPEELVLGDVIVLARGDQTPADARVLGGAGEVDESLLTGESEPVPKRPGDPLFAGSFVTEGSLRALLTAVGADSFAGALQTRARKVRRPRSELMASLTRVIRVVSIALLPIGAALYLRQTAGLGLAPERAVTKTVAAMLGMIPEGLILLTSVALAVGVVRLGRKKALVNELYGIENLARVDVLCLDKTGTLTTGRMTVTQVLPLEGGDAAATEAALRAFTAAFPEAEGATGRALAAAYPPAPGARAEDTVPFSSDRKWSAARIQGVGTLVVGAPERLLSGYPEAFAQAARHAAEGLRVLALMRTDQPLAGKRLPEGLRPLALVLLGDALRPEARETLNYFQEQGVALKVISGDSPLTVARVAAMAGLPGAERAVDCSALAQPADYDRLARENTVFGRVSPEDKRALVEALKRQGRTVAMVGDGVNDIPALKAADCSLALAGGSDAAARVAQIALLDADFTAVPAILLEGRRIINNITRASALFLVKNLFSALLAVALLALPFAYPFAPIQLTLISTLTIGFPSLVLALEPNRERVRGRFLPNVVARALPGGVTVAAVCLGLLSVGQAQGFTEPALSTLCTLVAGVAGLCVLALTCRPPTVLRAGLTALVSAAFAFAVLRFGPVFYLTPLTGPEARLLWLSFAAAVGLLLLLTVVASRLGRRGTVS